MSGAVRRRMSEVGLPPADASRLWAPGASVAPARQGHAVAQWRRGAGIFTIYLAYALVDLAQHHTWPALAFGLVLTAIFLWLYLGVGPTVAIRGDRRGSMLVLGAMVAVIAVYLAVCGGSGTVFVIYLLVYCVLVLPPPIGAGLVVTLAAAVTYLPQHVAAWDAHGAQYSVGGPCLLVGLTMFFLRNNRAAQQQLELANAEIGRLAAGQERMRIARDLHDLLGHALTTVTVKAELASRLVAHDPERAATEMQQVADLARQGLADVRSTVAGYREVSLGLELATAREVLAAAGVRAELPASTEEVPAPLRTLFGWVVREGVTNAVRHARADCVRIAVSSTSVEIVDDGVGGTRPPGSGLSGLAERVAAVGGELSAAAVPDGGFRLAVTVPA